MGKTTTTATPAKALHPNPRIAKALASGDRDKFSSMEAWGKSHGLTMAERRACRQLFRDLGEGVGRGRRYENSSTQRVASASRRVQAANAKAAKAAKSQPKAKAEAPAPEPQPAGEQQGE